MSELTTCNYCNWKNYKRKYGKHVKLGSSSSEEGWSEMTTNWPSSKVVVLDGKVIGWFAELGDHCVC